MILIACSPLILISKVILLNLKIINRLNGSFYIQTYSLFDLILYTTGELMNKNISVPLLIAFSTVLLASCTSSASGSSTLPAPQLSVLEASAVPPATPTVEIITLTDALARSVTIVGQAERIVSLAPNITETLFAIGAADQIVATDNLSVFPSQAQDLPKIGDFFADFDAKAYTAFAPQLVLVNEDFPLEGIFGLEALGIPVFVLGNPIDIDGVLSNISLIGTLSGNQSLADAFLQEMDTRLNKVTIQLQAAEDQPSVFYELEASDPAAPWTYGSGTLQDEILRFAGAVNVAENLSGAWVQISLNDLLLADPQIILLADAAFGVEAQSLALRDSWPALAAVQNGAIFPIDDSLLSSPGPRIIDVIETLAALFHPNLFE